MSKYKPKVEFNGKEMNLLEAKLCICGLEWGIINVNLNEEEKTNYMKWKKIRENRNQIAIKLVKEEAYKKLKERDYLIETLNRKIKEAYKKTPDSYEDKNSSETIINPFRG
jgi:hypothetical protein